MSATLAPAPADPRTEQRMTSLAAANRIRLEMAGYKRDLAALPYRDGCLKLARDLRDLDAVDGPLGRLTIATAIRTVTRLGDQMALRILKRAGIVHGARKVRDVTPRQRELVAFELLLRGRYSR